MKNINFDIFSLKSVPWGTRDEKHVTWHMHDDVMTGALLKLLPYLSGRQWVKTLRPRQNGRHFPDDIFKWIFLNENVWISINILLKFVGSN